MEYFFDDPKVDYLENIEEQILYMHEVVRGSLLVMALALGRIKIDRLYMKVASSFREYLRMRRTKLPESTAYAMAKSGENMIRYRNYLEDNKIRLSSVVQKMRYITPLLVDRDPLLWDRMLSLSDKQFQVYVRDQSQILQGIIVNDNSCESQRHVYTRGASLVISGQAVKGINLNDFKLQTFAGKRPVVIWVDDDDKAVRRIKRKLSKFLVE
ncbi:MAG: hypothetical protein PF447_08205 [Spirochaetaceae bacterium]|jgi:hypothetical protein|nr:hypothetical protein [Spirochaetaceae bacterium]